MHSPFRSNFFHFHAVFGKNLAKQECIPVGCVTTAALTATGCQYPVVGVSVWRGVSVQKEGVSVQREGLCPEGVSLPLWRICKCF